MFHRISVKLQQQTSFNVLDHSQNEVLVTYLKMQERAHACT